MRTCIVKMMRVILWTFLTLIIPQSEAKCKVLPLSRRTDWSANIILSGTVRSFYMKGSGGPFAGKLRVRRVFRGDQELEGRQVVVEGFGSPDICISTPRLGETKVFFLEEVHGSSHVKRFRLQSDIVKLNLKNLKILWKVEDLKTGLNENCSWPCSPEKDAICADNGQIFQSECTLKQEECRSKKQLKVVASGQCHPPSVAAPNSLKRPDSSQNSSCPSKYWQPHGALTCRPCLCSSTGSQSRDCDSRTGQCPCKPQWGGPLCTECLLSEGVGCRGVRSLEGPSVMADSAMVSTSVIKIKGALGSFCLKPGNCEAEGSECWKEQCRCRPGHVQQSPFQCLAPPPTPCSFSPCEGGGICEEHDGTFSCNCSPDRSGRYCENKKVEENTYTEAGFTGGSDSYIALNPPRNSVTRTSIQLSFRSFSKEGLLLLALQRNNRVLGGDFLSLALVNSQVEVKYDLGSGPITLLSRDPVTLGAWHTVVFRRYHRDGMLQVDSHDPVRGKVGGRSKSLNIRGTTYLGGFPNNHSSAMDVGGYQGLQGCMKDLSIQRRAVSLTAGTDSSINRSVGILPCGGHPCSRAPCKNGGECNTSVRGRNLRSVCHCKGDWSGSRCGKKKSRKKRKKGRKKKTRRRHRKKKWYDKSSFPVERESEQRKHAISKYRQLP